MEGDELPAGWAMATLGDALDQIIGGGTPSKGVPEYFKGTIPLMTVKDMKVSRPFETGFNISEEALQDSSAKIVPADTVIIATRMGLGKVVRPKMDTAINQDLKALFPSEALEKSYLEWWLHSIARKIEAMGTGTTVKGVRLNEVKALDIPLAPLSEQQRIVEKIETLFAELDKGEEALREVQKLLARYRQSVLKAAVTGTLIAKGPNDWVSVVLGDLLADIRYGTAKKCRSDVAGTPVLRIPNVVGGDIDLADLKFTELTEKELEKLSLSEGDVLIVRSNGSANLVGRGAIVTTDAVGMAYAGYLIRLRLDRNRILPAFLHIVLNSPEVRARIERQAKSTSGVHNLNSAEMKAIAFHLPDIDTQAGLVETVEEAIGRIEQGEAWCETELKRSAALRQSILKDAFSGKLVPQDPSDEPADKLLERIRAARTEKPKTMRKKASA